MSHVFALCGLGYRMSFVNLLMARVQHLSRINLLVARPSHASLIDLMKVYFMFFYINLPIARVSQDMSYMYYM